MSGLQQTPSMNIGVRSMSFDYENDELLHTFESRIFAIILREAANSLDVLTRTARRDRTEPGRKVVRPKGSLFVNDERMMIYGEDAGLEPVVPSVGYKLMDDRCAARVLSGLALLALCEKITATVVVHNGACNFNCIENFTLCNTNASKQRL